MGWDGLVATLATRAACWLHLLHFSQPGRWLDRTPAGTLCSSAPLRPVWLHCPLAAGHGPTFARTLTQVCSGWRRGIGGERSTLQRLRFTCLELVASSSGDGSSSRSSGGVPAASTTAPSSQAQRQRAGLPWLVRQSVAAGNVAATVAAARWLDRGQAERRPTCPHNAAAAALAAGAWYGGCEAAAGAVAAASSADAAAGISEAARLWRAASKLGHPEAQWRLGWAHYKARARSASASACRAA